MADRITYVMLRIDETVEDPDQVIQEMVRDNDGVRIDGKKSITTADEDFGGGPVIYFP